MTEVVNDSPDPNTMNEGDKAIQELSNKIANVVGPIFESMLPPDATFVVALAFEGNVEKMSIITPLHILNRTPLLAAATLKSSMHAANEVMGAINAQNDFVKRLMEESKQPVDGEIEAEDEVNDTAN